ncbi:MAG: hypothetical protein GXY48_06000 [Methanomicrobiales archaeon]|nr:hypothetical protein [Methanomicrobiales archaeon]
MADYSIGTIIETTGSVHEKFSGTWNMDDGNGINVSGIYSDSEITNGGNFNLKKQLGMRESSSSQNVLDTQKTMSYSSGHSGGHLMAEEFMSFADERRFNNTAASICFSDPYNESSNGFHEQTASFSINNAKQVSLSSSGRYSAGSLDYSINTGEPGNRSSIGLDGTLKTQFEGKTITNGHETRLYDRTLISGIIESFSRIYHGGETQELSGISSSTGSMMEKTLVTTQFINNNTIPGSIIQGDSVYSADMMSNGGRTMVTRQVTGGEKISAERIITYKSEGNRSIQASEHAFTSRFQLPETGFNNPVCVFAGPPLEPDNSQYAPYKEASAKTGVAGVSSAQISSSTILGDISDSYLPNLEYRAKIEVPIGFDASLVERMQDTDEDGRFEDLNGNGNLDMQDLVLLFQNFRWIGESNISARIDFNQNGRADYADIVTIFQAMNRNSADIS